MKRPRRRHPQPIVLALYANAAALSLILIVLIARASSTGDGLSDLARAANALEPVAFAQDGPQAQPRAGASGLFLMPGQLSTNTWGCWVLDANVQTLAAYQYYPGDKMLRLVAARNIRFDRQLGNYQTAPAPDEVERMVEQERQGPANPLGDAPAGAGATPATQPATQSAP
jgi:hypothetical protein